MCPFAGMPRVVQWLAEVLPLTHFMRLIRGIMLRGANLVDLWPEVFALLLFTTVMMTAAILRLREPGERGRFALFAAGPSRERRDVAYTGENEPRTRKTRRSSRRCC